MVEETNVLRKINEEIDNYKHREIQIVPGFLFNQKEIIETIYFYYNSKFETGEIDVDGDKKYFYNIVKNPCKIYTKAIDFDTKDIRILTSAGQNKMKTWLFDRDLKFWMKDKKFGKVINRILTELPIFGSCVLKIVDNEPYFVDLRNFIVEQSADTLEQSNFITEIHNYTIPEFRKVAQKVGWNKSKVEEAIKKFREMKGVHHLTVYERYGEVEDNKENYTYRRVCIADVGNEELQQNGITIPRKGVELSSDEIDDNPYWEFHLDKIPGRWLGVGVVESLIEPQIRQNELSNLQAKGSYWAALRLFQTRDQAVSRNLMSDARNGEVLNTDFEITQIDMSDRNLAFFNEEYLRWMKNRDELTFSYDVIQGERLPAGTPLGSAQLAASMTNSYFDQVRENIALDLKELLYEVILPNFEKSSTPEHILRLAGEDVEKLRDVIISQKTLDELMSFLARNNKLPTQIQLDTIKAAISERVKQGKEELVGIPKDFYKGIKYAIDIDITGESVDTRVSSQTKFAILQAITADPTILQDPVKKKFLFSIAEDAGINMDDFVQETVNPMQEMLSNVPMGRAGGGVSRPTITQNPIQGEVVNTL